MVIAKVHPSKRKPGPCSWTRALRRPQMLTLAASNGLLMIIISLRLFWTWKRTTMWWPLWNTKLSKDSYLSFDSLQQEAVLQPEQKQPQWPSGATFLKRLAEPELPDPFKIPVMSLFKLWDQFFWIPLLWNVSYYWFFFFFNLTSRMCFFDRCSIYPVPMVGVGCGPLLCLLVFFSMDP